MRFYVKNDDSSIDTDDSSLENDDSSLENDDVCVRRCRPPIVHCSCKQILIWWNSRRNSTRQERPLKDCVCLQGQGSAHPQQAEEPVEDYYKDTRAGSNKSEKSTDADPYKSSEFVDAYVINPVNMPLLWAHQAPACITEYIHHTHQQDSAGATLPGNGSIL